MSEPFDSKYKLFKQIGVPFSGMNKDNTDTLEHDGSHLTIRDDLVADELLGNKSDILESFRFDRYKKGKLHPRSKSPFPWS